MSNKLKLWLKGNKITTKEQEHRELNYWTILKQKSKDQSCVFLDSDTNQCTIYEARPLQCSTYPFWPRFMSSSQAWNGEVRITGNDASIGKIWTMEQGGCEGMHHMPKIPSEQTQIATPTTTSLISPIITMSTTVYLTYLLHSSTRER